MNKFLCKGHSCKMKIKYLLDFVPAKLYIYMDVYNHIFEVSYRVNLFYPNI